MKLTFFATLGFPGSGKTYFSERLAKEYKIFHLNSDRLRGELFKKPKHTPEEHAKLFAIMDFIAEHLLAAGISVIYDTNSTKRIYRKRLQRVAKKYKAKFILLNFTETPVDLAMRRLEKRAKLKSTHKTKYYLPVTVENMHRLRDENEPPLKSEPQIVMDGRKTYKENLKLLKKVLI